MSSSSKRFKKGDRIVYRTLDKNGKYRDMVFTVKGYLPYKVVGKYVLEVEMREDCLERYIRESWARRA